MDSITNLFRVSMIATCSDSVNELCDFRSILRDHSLVTGLSRVTFRDLSSNSAYPIEQVRFRINSYEDLLNRRDADSTQQLHQVVLDESNKYHMSDIIDLDDTPWFERWKEKFISVHNNYDHDFMGSNFGVFIILSSQDLQNFDSMSSKLLAQVRSNTTFRFMANNFLEHFVIINSDEGLARPEEENTDINVVPEIFQQTYSRFSNCFGHNNCSWLNISQDQPSLSVLPFLKNFIANSLVPWCERQVRVLNESISTRKGLRRNLVIATRQLLNIGQTSYVNQSVVYTPEAGEVQCRKLGDIAMCLGLYELASTSYDLAKKEFLNDGAWLYYAGACEAYAASMFMLNKFQRHHIEKAVTTYMDPCKSLALATRASLLATDILKQTCPIDAAKFFITLTGNDSDLQSGLFLEQASRCYIKSGLRLRKASFYYVLAGYRYGRCNLGSLSLRCYAQFDAKEWTAAAEYVKLSTKHVMESSI